MSRVLDRALQEVYPERARECAANDAAFAASIDPLFAAAHYMDGRDLHQNETRCYVCNALPQDGCQAIDGEVAECPRPGRQQ